MSKTYYSEKLSKLWTANRIKCSI